MVITNLE